MTNLFEYSFRKNNDTENNVLSEGILRINIQYYWFKKMLYEQDNINKFIVNSYYASVKTLNLEFLH